MENLRSKSLSKDAIAKIESIKDANEQYEDFFKDKQNDWNEKYQELTVPVSKELSISTLREIDEKQSSSLSYRGEIAKEIATYQNKLNKEIVYLKEDGLDSVIFLVSGLSNFKFKSADQTRSFLESVTAERKRACEIIKSYIGFLRDLNQNLKDYQFSFKNIIDLMDLLNN